MTPNCSGTVPESIARNARSVALARSITGRPSRAGLLAIAAMAPASKPQSHEASAQSHPRTQSRLYAGPRRREAPPASPMPPAWLVLVGRVLVEEQPVADRRRRCCTDWQAARSGGCARYRAVGATMLHEHLPERRCGLPPARCSYQWVVRPGAWWSTMGSLEWARPAHAPGVAWSRVPARSGHDRNFRGRSPRASGGGRSAIPQRWRIARNFVTVPGRAG
jgi:hypothetical protein